jgi:hypothetical protein
MDNSSQSQEPKRTKRQKETQEQKLSKIELKESEKVRLSKVFDQLCAYRKSFIKS